MKALVLAAGRGTRVAATTDCKPLMRVMGLPLIERAVATAMCVGVDEFVVVLGHQADRVEARLLELARKRQASIRVVRAERWSAGNGASLLAARDCFDEPFLLLMGDHIVSEAIIERVLDRGLGADSCVLAVDRGSSPWVDPSDVTRVRLSGDRIVEIGKGLPGSEIYDTGVFLCSPAIFDAAERALAASDGSVSGAVRELAARGAAAAVDVSGELWIDVDTPRDARHARRALTAAAGKSRDGWVSRVLNRPVSRRVLTPLLLRVAPGISANQVSLLSFGVGALAAAALAVGQPLLGAAAIHLASLLDGSDGEIARLKRLESPFGRYLDAVLDRYADSLILAGMLFFAWTAAGNRALLGSALEAAAFTVGALAISGNWLVSYTTARASLDLDHRYEGRWIGGGRGRDLRLLILALAGVAAVVHPVAALAGLAAVAGLTNAIALRRLIVSRAAARGVGRLVEVEAVIYDLDGTLLDSMPALTAIATELIAAHDGIDAAAARARYLETVGADFATQLDEIVPSHPSNAEVAERFELRKELALEGVRPFGDVVPALRALRARGVRQFVCSSTRRELVSSSLVRAGLLPWLDGWTGYRPGHDKSRQIASLLREHGLDATKTLFVGDSSRDTAYARGGGVAFRGLSRTDDGLRFARLGVEFDPDLRSLVRAWDRAMRVRTAVGDAPPADERSRTAPSAAVALRATPQTPRLRVTERASRVRPRFEREVAPSLEPRGRPPAQDGPL
jgi:CDP-L-myo-inositol myo-inositolphosphotransferase